MDVCACDMHGPTAPHGQTDLDVPDNCSVVNTAMWYHRDNRENSILYGSHIIYASTPCGPGGSTECTFQFIGNRRLVCSPGHGGCTRQLIIANYGCDLVKSNL